MSTLSHFLDGFQVALLPLNLLMTAIGVVLGMVLGVLPGLGPAVGVALLLPVTFGMDPTSALIMLSGIYYGAMYGGSVSAILINTPGEAASVMTALDGYALAQKGRAGAALAAAAIGSFVAGTLGVLLLGIIAGPLAIFSLKFGPAEYFALMLFAMTAVSTFTGNSLPRAAVATLVGLVIATVGQDSQTGIPRFTFGIQDLSDGVEFLVVVTGLFAVSEVFKKLDEHGGEPEPNVRIRGSLLLNREEARRSVAPICRGSIIGFIVGALPGAGTTIATMMSYAAEVRISRHPELFGKGAIEGVAGPEAANNSASMGAMVPMLALGIPGSATTAVLLGALIMYGIQPGPLLFTSQSSVVWPLVDSMYIGNLMLIVLALPLVGLFVRLLYVPAGILFPLILVFGVVGVYAVAGSTFSLILLLGFGLFGYLLKKCDVPVAPLILALVLGDKIEQSFRQSLALSGGNPSIFFASPLAIVLWLLTIGSIGVSLWWLLRSRVGKVSAASATTEMASE